MAQHYGIAPCSLTYSQALQSVDALAGAYRGEGLRQGQRVGLLLENRPAFFLNWLALNALGVSVVPISAELRAAELEYLVGHSEIAMAVVQRRRVCKLSKRQATPCGSSAGPWSTVKTM